MPLHPIKPLIDRFRSVVANEHIGILSIRNRLLVAFVAVALVPSLMISFNAIQFGKQSILNEKSTQFFALSNHKAGQISDAIGTFKNQITTFAQTDGPFAQDAELFIAEPSSKSRIYRDFDQFLYNNPAFFEISLLDANSGTIVASSAPETEGSPHSDATYFIEGKRGVFLDPFQFSPIRHDIASTFSLPIRNRYGQLLSVLMARLNHESLNEFLSQNYGLGKTGISYIVNHEGRYVLGMEFGIRPPPNIITLSDHPLLDSGGIRAALSNVRGGSIYDNYAHKPVLGYYQSLPVLDAGLLIEQDLHEVLVPIFDLERLIVFYSLLALAIALTMAKLISSRISKPIVQLAQLSTYIASGKRVAIPLLPPVDEVGVLSQSIAQMTDHLLGSLSDIRQIIETMPDALFIVNEQGIIVSANTYAYRLTGYSKHEVEGSTFGHLVRFQEDRVPSSNAPGVETLDILAHLDTLGQRGALSDLNMLCIPKKGSPIPVLLSKALLPGRGHQPNRIVVIAQDLRRQRRYAKERVDAIVPALSRMSLGDFSFKLELPPQNDEFTDLVASIQLMADNLRELVEENQNKAAEIFASNLKLRKSHTTLLKSKESIEAEKSKADALLGSIGEGIIAIDLKGKVLLMNQQAERMFDRSTASVLGNSFAAYFNFQDQSGKPINMESTIFEHVVSKKTQHFTTVYFARPNAERLPLATTLSPILQGKKLIGIIGTFRDIRRETEIDKAKSEFVSLASHQLRTPLTAVKWLLEELMRKGGFNARQLGYLTDIQSSTGRLITLVNDLLNVSRLESGVLTIEPRPVDLGKWIEAAVKEYRFMSKAKQQRIEFEKPSTPVMLSIDPELYRQILDNIVSNAIKYSFNGKTIVIKLARKSHGVTVSVKDQGIGITSNEKKSLFTKFFRTAEAAKFSTTSSGLGLYIIKKILDISGGSIIVESEKDKGTLVSVTYPLKGMIAKKGAKTLI
ncbi:PAS domain-containing protein [Candidatus Peregrinibacteria bacterium]|nr:PAS domain-containing protein [Candidatus Peregrinibacteria bacterium]